MMHVRYENMIDDSEHAGEESGREEAANDWPMLPLVSRMSQQRYAAWRRELTWYGRARAQGMYGLHGRAARIFAQNWAAGYAATCRLFEEDGHLINDATVEYTLCAILHNRIVDVCR
jgi:hypothetical protein